MSFPSWNLELSLADRGTDQTGGPLVKPDLYPCFLDYRVLSDELPTFKNQVIAHRNPSFAYLLKNQQVRPH